MTDMRTCYACGFSDDEGDYITVSGLCLDCAAFVAAYECTADCRTRAHCTRRGAAHLLCGLCHRCFRPKHHCSGVCEEYYNKED